jgi:hypothetical protein
MTDIAAVLIAFAFGLALATWLTTYWYRGQLRILKQRADSLDQDYTFLAKAVMGHWHNEGKP